MKLPCGRSFARTTPKRTAKRCAARRCARSRRPRPARRESRAGEAREAVLGEPVRVLAVPANGEGDAVALRMLADLLEHTPITLELQTGDLLTSEILDAAK